MPEVWNLVDWINSQLDIAERTISELDSIVMKNIEKYKEEKRTHKDKRNKSKLWDNLKWPNM